jgi:hypothetical protein
MYDYYISPCDLVSKSLHNCLKLKILKIDTIVKMIKYLKIKNINIIDTEKYHINDLLSKPVSRNIYVGGGNFRVPELTEKYQDYFIGKYTLKEKYIKDNKLYNLMNSPKIKDAIKIGVHIRRGDYKIWANGKYYFDDNVYKKYMYTLANEIKHKYNRNIHYVIFSNKKTDIFENEYIYKSTEKWYIDHFLMSKCDYLIGPPSTFTMWASYIGKVKYYHIRNNSGNINLNDFQYCKA